MRKKKVKNWYKSNLIKIKDGTKVIGTWHFEIWNIAEGYELSPNIKIKYNDLLKERK